MGMDSFHAKRRRPVVRMEKNLLACLTVAHFARCLPEAHYQRDVFVDSALLPEGIQAQTDMTSANDMSFTCNKPWPCMFVRILGCR